MDPGEIRRFIQRFCRCSGKVHEQLPGPVTHVHQLPVKNEIVSATIQKQDNTGRKLTVEIYDGGKLIKSGSVTAPKGIVNINADLRTA